MIIRVGDFEHTLSDKYQVGHALTLGEAQALNAYRASLIRKTLARESEKTGQDGAGMGVLRAKAESLDKGFEFIPAARPRQRVASELESLVAEIARSEARKSMADEGYSEEEFDQRVRELSLAPRVIDEAREILSARRQAAKREFEALLS